MKDYEELIAIREAMKQELREAEQRVKELRRRIRDFERGGYLKVLQEIWNRKKRDQQEAD